MDCVAEMQGGLDYHKLRDMPLPELLEVHKNVLRINKARERAINKKG